MHPRLALLARMRTRTLFEAFQVSSKLRGENKVPADLLATDADDS